MILSMNIFEQYIAPAKKIQPEVKAEMPPCDWWKPTSTSV